jgi:hypothetical protein
MTTTKIPVAAVLAPTAKAVAPLAAKRKSTKLVVEPTPTGKKSATSAPNSKNSLVVKDGKSQAVAIKAATVKVTKEIKVEKAKKPKLVRDSFTIPKAEYVVLDELKQRANKLSHPVKKSELLRAGLKALVQLSDTAFLTALAQVPIIKTGRPASV